MYIGKFTSDEVITENKIEPILSNKLYQTMKKYPLKNFATSLKKNLK